MLDDFRIKNYHGPLNTIIDAMGPVKSFYPEYETWIEDTVQSGLDNNTRTISVLKNDGKIAGLNILKDTEEEKKICSLFIHPDYRGESWMFSIFSNAIEILKTKKPVITIPSIIVKKYHGIIFTNKWEVTSAIPDRYQSGIVEYGFNEKDCAPAGILKT